MMKKNFHRYLGPLISVVLFTAAVWLLHSELKTHHLRDMVHTLEAISAGRLMAALVLSILGYLVMTSYKEGYRFEVLSLHAVSHRMPELKEISDAWLAEKNTREKGFSLGFFDPAYLRRFPVA